MIPGIDQADPLSKTQAIEQVFKVLQQGPELDQRQFAANLKRAMDEKKEKVEEPRKEERRKIRDENREHPAEDRYEHSDDSKEKTDESNQSDTSESSSSEHQIDMTV